MAVRSCDKFHRQFDGVANGDIQGGDLPSELLVRGKLVWWVFRGNHDGMGEAWKEFGSRLAAADGIRGSGPPGDIYLCDPKDHPGRWGEMLTILWAPRV